MANEQVEPIAPKMKDISSEYAEIMMLGNVLFQSGYFKDVRDQAQAVTKILFGRELGFSPIVSLSGIYIIEGKPAISANLFAAMIKRSGKYDYRIKEWDDERCVITFKQNVNGVWDVLGDSSFNKSDAARAGVWGKNTWAKYPKAMLFARALSQGERAYCPDVSSCALYVPEELGATVNESGEVLSVQDLPKSARPVAVTKEDIEIGSARNVTGSEATKGASSVVTPAVASDKKRETSGEAPASEAEVVRQLQKDGYAKPEFEGCIDKPRQIAFARAWAGACPVGIDKETARHQWLARRNYVDKDGIPTSAKIPLAIYEDEKRDAVNFARKLK